jgi:polyphosphate glucokinase
MQLLGIDVGGSGIKGALVNVTNGKLITERYRIPTPKPATPDAVAKVIGQIVSYFDYKGEVGCGFPTPLQHGVCMTGGNLHTDWKGTQVNQLFEKATGNKFYVVNDADAAGLAEIHYGAGKDVMGKVLMVTLGTGIGSALFLDGKLIPNTELGHLFNKNGDVFEKVAADSARKKEDMSRKAWGKRLNKYFRHLSLILSPDLFIVGGGSSKNFSRTEAKINTGTPLVTAETKNEAGIIGAAMAAHDHVK